MMTYLQQIAYATDIYNIERDDRLDFFRSKIHYAQKVESLQWTQKSNREPILADWNKLNLPTKYAEN